MGASAESSAACSRTPGARQAPKRRLTSPIIPDTERGLTIVVTTQGSSLQELLFGKPKDPLDPKVFHRISLVAFLAWVGLGADGLSSSAYGPDEAFRTLGEHTYLALGLALAVGLTVFVIAAAYSRIIEEFPHGGGGYLVATKLLGGRWGVISGCALLVDYV